MLYVREAEDKTLEILDLPWKMEGLTEVGDNEELKRDPALFEIKQGKVNKKPQTEIDKILAVRKDAINIKDEIISLKQKVTELEKREIKAIDKDSPTT